MNSKSLITGITLIAASFSFAATPSQGKQPKTAAAAQTGPRGFGPKRRIAVTDLEVAAGQQALPHPIWDKATDVSTEPPPIPPDLGSGVTDMLINELVKSGRYLVIDQTKAASADIEREKSIAGAQAASGAALQPQYKVTGAITEFRWNQSSLSQSLLSNYQRHEEGLGALVRVDVKIVDISTGQIWRSASAVGEGKGKATAMSIGTKFNSNSFKACPLGEAVRNAVSNCVATINRQESSLPWQGRVADVVNDEGRGLEIYVNAGATSGIHEGDEFEITRLSGSTRTHVGRCKVIRVEPDISVAVPTEGQGFQVTDSLSFIGPSKVK